MFRLQGKNRTFIHNLRLAALLSFVAGMVNVTGVLSIQTLITNVTGHFAYFAEEIMKRDYAAAMTFFVFIIFFFDELSYYLQVLSLVYDYIYTYTYSYYAHD